MTTRSQLRIATLWVVGVVTVAAGWAELVARNDLLDVNTGQAVFFTLAALAAPGLATAMRSRHPTESTGPLLGFTVLAAMLGACRTTDLGPLTPVAGVTALVLVLLPAVLVVRNPALQCPPRVVRFTTTCFWVAAGLGTATAVVLLVGGAVPAPLWDSRPSGGGPSLAIALLVGQTVIVAVASATLVAGYFRQDLSLNARRALRPMMLPAIGWCASVTASAIWEVVQSVGSPGRLELTAEETTTFVVLPALLVGALAAGVGWIDLIVRTRSSMGTPGGGRGGRTNVEQYLSRALADSSIRVLYPVAGSEWVDATGRPAVPDLDTTDRAVTLIKRGETVIGLIDQDAAVTAHPDAVELIATGAGLIMETEGLTAAANRDLERARLLAERLLSASDEPRALLRAELLAGPLVELDAARSALAQGAAVADVVPLLNAAATHVRTISHGVFPPSLTAGGLRTALDCQVLSEHRYDPVIEMTAYLVAVHDPEATIEESDGAAGPHLRIDTARRPSPDVSDRISALGGEITRADSRWSVTVPLVVAT